MSNSEIKSKTKPQDKRKTKTKAKVITGDLTEHLNQVAERSDTKENEPTHLQTANQQKPVLSEEEINEANNKYYDELFDNWDEREFAPQDFMIEVPVGSLESYVGYSSLMRQMHNSFIQMVAFYRSPGGGSLSVEEARAQAFHRCANKEEAKKILRRLILMPIDNLDFSSLMELERFAPRVAERFWERVKREGRKEFESGHLAANITFPENYMKGMWNIARYIGVRESFIDDWNPRGGIEIAMVDMLAQCWFQWQFWLEQTVKRSQTREIEVHPEYKDWLMRRGRDLQSYGITDGYWNRQTVSEQQAIEHAVQMADRFNRMFMRTLRQLRDLRRYAPVTINNPNQVNIANDGGQQVNISNETK